MKYLILLLRCFCVIILIACFSCGTGSGARKKQQQERQDLLRELQYGKLLAKEILQQYPVLNDKKASEYVNKVGKSVALFAGRNDIEYYFAILDTDDINAYAAPGGYVFITKGAVKKISSEAELAGVLGHEIGHINNRHIMKLLPPPREAQGITDRLAAFLVAQGAAMSSAFNKVVEEARDLLFVKGYKVEDEYQADESAVIYVSETGYYTAGLLDFLEKIENLSQDNPAAKVYNTHPPTNSRISRLKKFIEKEKIAMNSAKAADRYKENMDHILLTNAR